MKMHIILKYTDVQNLKVFADKSKHMHENTKTNKKNKQTSFVTDVKLWTTITLPQLSKFLYTCLERLSAPPQCLPYHHHSLYNLHLYSARHTPHQHTSDAQLWSDYFPSPIVYTAQLEKNMTGKKVKQDNIRRRMWLCKLAKKHCFMYLNYFW